MNHILEFCTECPGHWLTQCAYFHAVVDSGGTNPAMSPIQFAYRFLAPSNEEINVRYWETY